MAQGSIVNAGPDVPGFQTFRSLAQFGCAQSSQTRREHLQPRRDSGAGVMKRRPADQVCNVTFGRMKVIKSVDDATYDSRHEHDTACFSDDDHVFSVFILSPLFCRNHDAASSAHGFCTILHLKNTLAQYRPYPLISPYSMEDLLGE